MGGIASWGVPSADCADFRRLWQSITPVGWVGGASSRLPSAAKPPHFLTPPTQHPLREMNAWTATAQRAQRKNMGGWQRIAVNGFGVHTQEQVGMQTDSGDSIPPPQRTCLPHGRLVEIASGIAQTGRKLTGRKNTFANGLDKRRITLQLMAGMRRDWVQDTHREFQFPAHNLDRLDQV